MIREAMVATGTAAVSRLVLYRRERAVVLVPRGRGIVLWTLRYGDEVRPADDYFPKAGEGRGEATRLVTELIDARTESWSDRFVEDTVQEQMKKIVAGKEAAAAGRRQEPEAHAPTGGNVVSIMDALKRSVAARQGQGKKQDLNRSRRPASPGTLARDQCLPVGRGAAAARKSAQGSACIGDARRRVRDGEVGRADLRAELVPGERHRHRRAGAGAGAVGDDRGVVAAVAQVVDQDAAGPLRLGDRSRRSGRGRRPPSTAPSPAAKPLTASQPAASVGFSGRDDVQALAAGGLDEGRRARRPRAARAPRARRRSPPSRTRPRRDRGP